MGWGIHAIQFGLGASEQADRVTVYWPSGKTTSVDNVSQDLIVEER